ncbi:MAG: DUF3990 domain-containing protein [Muribaculaceae bacterium]|nr:DUF3990 domain-containing protein [Muribaculaceae bacterium]
MRVYHTSDMQIECPDNLHSRNALDFGKGFYVTKLKEQAEKYAQRFTALGSNAYLHEYEYKPCADFKIKVFEHYDDEWLRFVCNCRRGGDDYKQYDIIEGGVANDKVFRTVDLYMSGIYTLEQALQKLIYEAPNHQLCLISQAAIDCCLKLVEITQIKSEENGQD